MNQQDKELLLKDLSTRLPYGVMVKTPYNDAKLIGIVRRKGYTKETEYIDVITDKQTYPIRYVTPYLRPLSSMTEEEFESLKEYSGLKYDQLDLASFQNGTYKCLDFYLSEVPSYVVILVFDWLNKNHFDYRGLIERGLAIKVTKENNPYGNL